MSTRPSTDAGWLLFGQIMSAALNGAPTDFGVTTDEATSFKGVVLGYEGALAIAKSPETRTKVAVHNKQVALRELQVAIGKINQRVRGYSGITDEKLLQLGLAPRKKPTRKNPPTDVPNLEIRAQQANVISFVAHGTGKERALASDVTGVTVFSYVGETPPPTAAGWSWHGNYSRASDKLAFDPAVKGTAWLCAVFFNDRGQGPACEPVRINLAGGNVVPVGGESELKLAA